MTPLLAIPATKGPSDLAQEQFVKVQLLASTMDGAELPVGEATVPIADPMTESMNSWCLFEQILGTGWFIYFSFGPFPSEVVDKNWRKAPCLMEYRCNNRGFRSLISQVTPRIEGSQRVWGDKPLAVQATCRRIMRDFEEQGEARFQGQVDILV